MLSDLLYDLVQIHGPSGFEGRVAERLRAELEGCVDEVHIDKMGNLIAKKVGAEPERAVLIIAHTDEVSLVVQKVDDYVWFETVGWVNLPGLAGTPVTILTEGGDVEGVVCSRSAHLPAGSEPQDLWIDVGRDTARVSVGDPIVFAANARWLNRERTLLASKAVDDRMGCAILVELARRWRGKRRNTVYFVGAVQEEVGSWGTKYLSSHIQPQWAIAVDTAFAQDAATDRRKGVPLGSGPILRQFQMAQPNALYPAAVLFPSRRLNRLITEAAQEQNIPLNHDIFRYTFTDSTILYNENPEIECATLLIPRRYSHSPCEVVDITDGQRCVELLHLALAKLEGEK